MYENIFKVDEAGMHRKGNWLWWWWIFYYRRPKKTPKQLMILWSTKNEKRIKCNGLDIRLRDEFIKREGNSLNIDGVVAAWYYDGKKMHEDYLLNQTPVIVNSQGVKTRKPDSSFEVKGEGFKVKLRDLEFDVFNIQKSGFYASQHHESKFPGGFSYDIHKISRADFKASNGSGTAYFQRVRVNAPAPPWYWGVHHFDNGGALHYYAPHLSSTILTDKARAAWTLPLKQDFEFYDGKRVHKNKQVRVKREGSEKEKPRFIVESNGPAGKARVVIKSYAAAAWRFNKSAFNRLTYNEYPSLVEDFRFKNASGEWTLDDLGAGYGNAEHSTGLLW